MSTEISEAHTVGVVHMGMYGLQYIQFTMISIYPWPINVK